MEQLTSPWRKASASLGNGGDCVEVAGTASHALVRDTKASGDPQRVTLAVPATEWARFVRTLKK